MKYCSILAYLTFNFITNAQITLTSVDFAAVNDTVRMSQAIDPTIDFSTTGAGQTWDFSGLTPNAQELKYFQPVANAGAFVNFIFGTFAPVKYQASYFLPSTDLPLQQITAILPIGIQDVFQFSRKTADSLTSVGYAMTVSFNGSATTIPIQSDTIETPYDFPLAFGNTHFSRGATSVDFNPIYNAKWNQHRIRLTTVDGYGTITTPFGTFDALRIRHDIDEIDSLYTELPFIGGTWIPLDIPASHQYEWWTNGQKEPILRISTSDVFGNETVTAIEYRDIFRPEFASVAELSNKIICYPNPVDQLLTLTTEVPIKAVYIYSTDGKLIESIGAVVDNKVDLSFLPSGNYFVSVFTENSVINQQIIKK